MSRKKKSVVDESNDEELKKLAAEFAEKRKRSRATMGSMKLDLERRLEAAKVVIPEFSSALFEWKPEHRILQADASKLGIAPGVRLDVFNVRNNQGKVATFLLDYVELANKDTMQEFAWWYYNKEISMMAAVVNR